MGTGNYAGGEMGCLKRKGLSIVAGYCISDGVLSLDFRGGYWTA